jgi:hypothetical protein
MSNQIAGDSSMFAAIVDAKQAKDFSSIVLPDGSTSSATNWGQFKQEWTEKGQNLGCVMSAKCEPASTTTGTTSTSSARGQGHGNKGGNGQGKGHNK